MTFSVCVVYSIIIYRFQEEKNRKHVTHDRIPKLCQRNITKKNLDEGFNITQLISTVPHSSDFCFDEIFLIYAILN